MVLKMNIQVAKKTKKQTKNHKIKIYFCGITLMRTTWSSSCTCCGFFLQMFSAPFTTAVPQNIFFPLDLPPPHKETFWGQNCGDPTGSSKPTISSLFPWLRVVFQEHFKGNFHPGHQKSTDLSILRTQGSNEFWLEYGKFEK